MQRVTLANAMSALGNDVTVVVLQQFGNLSKRLHQRVSKQRARYIDGLKSECDLLIVGTTRTEAVFALISFLRRQPRIAVAIHNPVGNSAPRISRLALIASAVVPRLVALTPAHAAAIHKEWGLRATDVISNAITPAASSAGVDDENSVHDVGYIGRLSTHHKGIDRLLAAIEHSSTLTLLIAGHGPDEDFLKARAAAGGSSERIQFLGETTPEEFFLRVKVVALLSRYEAQPMVILEAQRAGIPLVVSTEVGATNNALCVDADAPEKVAAALLEAASNPDALLEKSRGSWSDIDMASAYLKLVEESPPTRRRIEWKAFTRSLIRGRSRARSAS